MPGGKGEGPRSAHRIFEKSVRPLPLWKRFANPEGRARFALAPKTAAGRRAAWFDLLFVDFGVLRLFWKNRAGIAPGIFRGNQPTPLDLNWLKAKGIRTIITARHDARHGGNALMRDLCEKEGITFITLPFFSREAPTRAAILAAAAAFSTLETPVFIHCKSGADRAGFLSALYLIIVKEQPVQEALRQLSLRHLHIKQSRTGILDAVFDAYLEATRESSKPFLDWVREDYDAEALTRAFRHGIIADVIDRVILRHE